MPLLKRPAAAAQGAAAKEAKKQRQEDPIAAKCGAICDLLQTADGYPKEVISMLTACVKSALQAAKEDRHAFQEHMVEMVQEVLTSVEARSVERIAGLESKASNADAEKATRDQNVLVAEAVVAEQTQVLDLAKAALLEATQEVTKTKEDKLQAEVAQSSGDAAYHVAVEKKSKLEAVLTGDYEGLKQGTLTGVRNVQRFVKLGKEFGWDTNLISAAEATLVLPVAQRGTFDSLVLTQIEGALAAGIAAQTSVIDNDEAGRAQREQAVQAARSLYDAAAEHERTQKEALVAAKTALSDAEAQKKAVEKSVRDFGPEMVQVAAELHAAQESQRHVAGVLGGFRELANRSTAPKPMPVEEAEATAPMKVIESTTDEIADAAAAVGA